MVGFTSAPASHDALHVAHDLATRLDAHLHVVHCVDATDYPVDPDGADWETQVQTSLARAREQVGQVLSSFEGMWTFHAWRGQPAALLTRVADEHDALMIVIGARPEGIAGAVAWLLSPSTSHALLGHHAHRPVLVVPRAAGSLVDEAAQQQVGANQQTPRRSDAAPPRAPATNAEE